MITATGKNITANRGMLPASGSLRGGGGGGFNEKPTMVLLLVLKPLWHNCIVMHSNCKLYVTGAELELDITVSCNEYHTHNVTG